MPIGGIILGVLFNYPNIFVKSLDILKEKDFDEAEKNIYNELLDQYNSARTHFRGWSFDTGLLAEAREKINVMLLYAEDKYGEFSEEAVAVELEKLVDKLKKDRRVKRLKDIEFEIKEAEKAEEKNRMLALLMEQQELLSK